MSGGILDFFSPCLLVCIFYFIRICFIYKTREKLHKVLFFTWMKFWTLIENLYTQENFLNYHLFSMVQGCSYLVRGMWVHSLQQKISHPSNSPGSSWKCEAKESSRNQQRSLRNIGNNPMVQCYKVFKTKLWYLQIIGIFAVIKIYVQKNI